MGSYLSRKLFFAAVCLSVMVIISGCQTRSWYEERAVNRARDYIMENCRYLAQQETEYVRFHKPIIMTEDIIGFTSSKLGAPSPTSQVCITWLIPGRDKALIVFGWGSGDFYDWQPNRVFWKRYDKPQKDLIKAREAAALYAINNLLFLKQSQVNRVRFTPPKQEFTKFDLSKGRVPFEDADDKFKEELASGPGRTPKSTKSKAVRDKYQVSLYWIDPTDVNQRIVVSGPCSDSALGGFKPVSAFRTNADDLLNNRGETPPPPKVKTPAKKQDKKKKKDKKKSSKSRGLKL